MFSQLRLLTLEERISLALMFFEISELQDLCRPSINEALRDPIKVHRINELLTEYRVAAISTELDEHQQEALRTGVKPVVARVPIRLSYAGVLEPEDGERLTELFNHGALERDGVVNHRPVSHMTLTVVDTVADELREIHDRWMKSRISIPMDCEEGAFWISPERTRKIGNTQHYTCVRSMSQLPSRDVTEYPMTTSPILVARQPDGDWNKTWRRELDTMVRKNPDLAFVHFMLHHFLQPAHVQEIHRGQLKGKALGIMTGGHLYRVVGVTPHGTLQMTRNLNQELVYDTTVPFMDVYRTCTWQELKDPTV